MELIYPLLMSTALKVSHDCAFEIHKQVYAYHHPEFPIVEDIDETHRMNAVLWLNNSTASMIHFVHSPYRIALNLLWYWSLYLAVIHNGWIYGASTALISFFSFIVFRRNFSFWTRLWVFGIIGIFIISIKTLVYFKGLR
jgi:hypothetical protein